MKREPIQREDLLIRGGISIVKVIDGALKNDASRYAAESSYTSAEERAAIHPGMT